MSERGGREKKKDDEDTLASEKKKAIFANSPPAEHGGIFLLRAARDADVASAAAFASGGRCDWADRGGGEDEERHDGWLLSIEKRVGVFFFFEFCSKNFFLSLSEKGGGGGRNLREEISLWILPRRENQRLRETQKTASNIFFFRSSVSKPISRRAGALSLAPSTRLFALEATLLDDFFMSSGR